MNFSLIRKHTKPPTDRNWWLETPLRTILILQCSILEGVGYIRSNWYFNIIKSFGNLPQLTIFIRYQILDFSDLVNWGRSPKSDILYFGELYFPYWKKHCAHTQTHTICFHKSQMHWKNKIFIADLDLRFCLFSCFLECRCT